ncbi:ABC transporter substrate-binding protein [Oceaniglobus ichthyenteri]|uniref:ABC transporter substrate-binding protein n=1 Tax=Oceaniglobus ichthyenteri TaxID=2136177 RepID=UPI0013DD9622|nr:ABC transporter substrate-binding protein [Oceaniglobus ichthyenteri]
MGNRLITATGGISRRKFGLILGAGAGASALGLGTSVRAATPTRGGVLRIGIASQSTNDTFDSAKALYHGDFIRCTSLYNHLTRLDEQLKAQPELAVSFEPSADVTEWTFTLRKGVEFHDGSPLTAEDVAFSILRHKEERVASSVRRLVQNITDVVVDGPDTVVVKLAEPDGDVPVMFGIFQFAIVKAGTYDFAKPNGTGPFTVSEFAPGVRTICTRNDNYWKNGQPYIDGFEMFSITDPVARANALLSGDADVVVDLKGPSIDEVAKSDVAQPFITNAARFTSFQAAVDIPPGDRENLGLALSYLIDRERVLKTVLRGNGVIANDVPVMPGTPYFNDALPQRTLDHDKAKFHLAKAGIGNSQIDLHVSDASVFSTDIGQLLQREAVNAGLNLNLRREPADSYWSAVAGKRALFATTFNPWATVNMFLNLTWKSGAAWNFSHYNNPDLDKMIDAARATVDEAQRVEIYADIQETLHNTGAQVLPAFISYVDGVSTRVEGLTPVPIGGLGGFNFTDRVWFKS